MLTIIKNDDVRLPVTFTDSNDDPIDLTGSTVFFTVKLKLSDTDASAVISKDITSHTDAVNGETAVVLTNIETNVDPNIYYWDLQIKTAVGLISSTQSDRLQIIDEVTIRKS